MRHKTEVSLLKWRLPLWIYWRHLWHNNFKIFIHSQDTQCFGLFYFHQYLQDELFLEQIYFLFSQLLSISSVWFQCFHSWYQLSCHSSDRYLIGLNLTLDWIPESASGWRRWAVGVAGPAAGVGEQSTARFQSKYGWNGQEAAAGGIRKWCWERTVAHDRRSPVYGELGESTHFRSYCRCFFNEIVI